MVFFVIVLGLFLSYIYIYCVDYNLGRFENYIIFFIKGKSSIFYFSIVKFLSFINMISKQK